MNREEQEILDSISRRVIGAAFEVANGLGAGFLEKVYERALVRELALQGIRAASQVSYSAMYKGQRVGDYCSDLVVEDQVIVEHKCVDRLGKEHLAQCLNYLRASGLAVCLLVNFQRSTLEWQRVVSPHWKDSASHI